MCYHTDKQAGLERAAEIQAKIAVNREWIEKQKRELAGEKFYDRQVKLAEQMWDSAADDFKDAVGLLDKINVGGPEWFGEQVFFLLARDKKHGTKMLKLFLDHIDADVENLAKTTLEMEE